MLHATTVLLLLTGALLALRYRRVLVVHVPVAVEPAVSIGVYVVVVPPNLIGYALLATRSRHRDVASPA